MNNKRHVRHFWRTVKTEAPNSRQWIMPLKDRKNRLISLGISLSTQLYKTRFEGKIIENIPDTKGLLGSTVIRIAITRLVETGFK